MRIVSKDLLNLIKSPVYIDPDSPDYIKFTETYLKFLDSIERKQNHSDLEAAIFVNFLLKDRNKQNLQPFYISVMSGTSLGMVDHYYCSCYGQYLLVTKVEPSEFIKYEFESLRDEEHTQIPNYQVFDYPLAYFENLNDVHGMNEYGVANYLINLLRGVILIEANNGQLITQADAENLVTSIIYRYNPSIILRPILDKVYQGYTRYCTLLTSYLADALTIDSKCVDSFFSTVTIDDIDLTRSSLERQFNLKPPQPDTDEDDLDGTPY